MKVMAALDYKRIPYRIQRVNPQNLQQELPPPHTVPVMLIDGAVIGDSTQILRALDDRITGEKFFPPGNADVERLESHYGTTLNAYVLYFNWLNIPTFNVSMRIVLQRLIPSIWFVACMAPETWNPNICTNKSRLRWSNE